jgi:hypothetical protein
MSHLVSFNELVSKKHPRLSACIVTALTNLQLRCIMLPFKFTYRIIAKSLFPINSISTSLLLY